MPFYAWIRFFIHLYLIMPGSQGATFAYQEYIEPFLYQHEREIDNFITESHDRGKAAGLAYLGLAIEWVKVNILGFAPAKPESPRPAGQSYAQNLMSRFQMPAARGSNDLYGLVNQALSGAAGLYANSAQNPAAAAGADLARSGAPLVPDNIRNNDDRLSYVSSQRQRLESLLQAFDREHDNIRSAQSSGNRYHDNSGSAGSLAGGMASGMASGLAGLGANIARNRSESEFDRIERDEASPRPPYPTTPPPLGRRTSSGWMPWNWQRPPPSQGGERERDREDPLAYGKEAGESRRGHSTGFDLGDR